MAGAHPTRPTRAGEPGGEVAGSGRTETTGDILYDAVYGGAFGGSAIALFFLVLDSLAGHPLFTPSLMGSVLFTGEVATPATPVRLDMVAYYSALHFAAFAVLGTGVSLLSRTTGLSKANTLLVAGVVFATLTLAFFGAERLVMPGVSRVIGAGWILVGNALTAVVIAGFLRWAHADR